MHPILHIGHTDLRLFFKHKSAYVWLFALPLAFVYFMGFANRGPGDPANRRPPVLIENEDTNFLGRVFLDELGAQGLWLLSPTNREAAGRTVRIPADFTDKVLRQEQSKIGFSTRASSVQADDAIIELRLARALIALNGHVLEAATAGGGERPLTEEGLRRVLSVPDPVRLDARFAGRKPVPSGYSFSLPGNLVMYVMLNLLVFGGATMAAERRHGVIRRVMVHPVTRNQVVMGKVYGLFLLGVVQVLFFMAMGRFVFGLNLGANLPAVALVLLVFAWVAASLGVVVGSVSAAEDRVIGISILASILMAALGGCWWPLELASPTLRTIALCLPTGWALAALHQLISFGSGFTAALTPLAALFGFGAAANLLAARFFRMSS
jgi:ABC-type multidrug transport system permease subunit